jgi:hypothetical protein
MDEVLARVEPAAVRSAIVVAVSLEDEWRPLGAGKTVPFACRRFVVVAPGNVDDFFEDDPLAASGGPPCP